MEHKGINKRKESVLFKPGPYLLGRGRELGKGFIILIASSSSGGWRRPTGQII